MKCIHKIARRSFGMHVLDMLLMLRTILYLGWRRWCPCCGWRFREFTRGGMSLRFRPRGYCPRCNSKARHRWLWLFLQEHTDLFCAQLKLFHVSPAYCLSRRFKAMPNLTYVGGNLELKPNVGLLMDIATPPIGPDAFDAIICLHVLEHVEEDLKAIGELYRVLKPGGWAIIAVPLQRDKATYEDPAIITPEARKRAFGERDHVRMYGYDFVHRLEASGFSVKTHDTRQLDDALMEKCGLRDDDIIFLCTKY